MTSIRNRWRLSVHLSALIRILKMANLTSEKDAEPDKRLPFVRFAIKLLLFR